MQLSVPPTQKSHPKNKLGQVRAMAFAPKAKILFVCGDGSSWIQMYSYSTCKFKGKGSRLTNPRIPQGTLRQSRESLQPN